MNRYNQVVGCVTPRETRFLFESLQRAGFNPVDTSWHNDASDSIEIVIGKKTFRVWVGDPEHEDEYYSKNHLVLCAEHSEHDEELGPIYERQIIDRLKLEVVCNNIESAKSDILFWERRLKNSATAHAREKLKEVKTRLERFEFEQSALQANLLMTDKPI